MDSIAFAKFVDDHYTFLQWGSDEEYWQAIFTDEKFSSSELYQKFKSETK